MEDISKKIVDKIKEEKIVPQSKWRLSLRSYCFWLLMAGMMIVGALFFSLLFLSLSDMDGDVLGRMGAFRFVRLAVITAPYLWIGLILLALVFGVLAFRKTAKGYRHSMIFTTSLVVLAISILGVLAHFSKINDRITKGIGKNFPYFQEMSGPRRDRWMKPEEGLLAGEIVDLGQDNFILLNLGGEEWKVYYFGETKIRRGLKLEKGLRVGVIGEETGEREIKAFVIRDLPFGEKEEDCPGIHCKGFPPGSPDFFQENDD